MRAARPASGESLRAAAAVEDNSRKADTALAEGLRSPEQTARVRRAAGADLTEELRGAGAISNRWRESGELPESIRAAGAITLESGRPAADRLQEQLIDPYYRANPPMLGCTIYSVQAIAGLGVAGCMMAGVDRGQRP
jgi:hypothetical protein